MDLLLLGQQPHRLSGLLLCPSHLILILALFLVHPGNLALDSLDVLDVEIDLLFKDVSFSFHLDVQIVSSCFLL